MLSEYYTWVFRKNFRRYFDIAKNSDIDILKIQNFEKIHFENLEIFIRYDDISKSLSDIYRLFRYYEIVIL